MKNKKMVIIIFSVLLVAIGIGIFCYNYYLPENRVKRNMEAANSFLANENWEEARIQLSKVIEVDPANLDAYIMLADVYMHIGDDENAMAMLQKVAELDPEREGTYFDMAEIYIKKGDSENAISMYKKIIGMGAKTPEAYIRLAEILIEQGRWEEAKSVLKEGLKKYKDDRMKERLAEVEKKLDEIEAERLAREKKEKWRRAKKGDVVEFGNIKWKVLRRKGKLLYLISDGIVAEMPFNDKNVKREWKDCSLRVWLNNDFYNATFKAAEKNAIIAQKVDDENSDNVWLLSENEAYKYFRSDAQRKVIGKRWWLRDRVEGRSYYFAATFVGESGAVYGLGKEKELVECGVRPVIVVDVTKVKQN